MPTSNSPWRNPWVLGWLGLVIMVIIANGIMVMLSVSTNPGLVTDEYYSAGRTLEQTILSRRAKNAEQTLVINVPETFHAQVPATFRLVGVDLAGVPIKADTVTFQAYRPADKSADFREPMHQEGAGRFVTDASFPLKGIWDVVVTIRRGEEEYHVGRRVNVTGR